MNKPRRWKEGMSHSISCTDEEWEMVCRGAERAGMSASAWFVHCALNVNPRAKRTIPLVLDETQQRDMVDAVEQLAGTISRDPETLARIEDDVRHLLKQRVRAMMRQGRADEARARLREAFGAEHARWIEDWAQRPRVDRLDETEGRPNPAPSADAAKGAGGADEESADQGEDELSRGGRDRGEDEIPGGPPRRSPWHALRVFLSSWRCKAAGSTKP